MSGPRNEWYLWLSMPMTAGINKRFDLCKCLRGGEATFCALYRLRIRLVSFLNQGHGGME